MGEEMPKKMDYRDFVPSIKSKGTEYFKKEIEKAGLTDQLPPFSDVVLQTMPPLPQDGYVLKLIDVVMDGGYIYDIYYSDSAGGGNIKRLYLHNKS